MPLEIIDGIPTVTCAACKQRVGILHADLYSLGLRPVLCMCQNVTVNYFGDDALAQDAVRKSEHAHEHFKRNRIPVADAASVRRPWLKVGGPNFAAQFAEE